MTTSKPPAKHSGSKPNGSFTLPDPDLIEDLRALADSLGYRNGTRGGNVSGLIAAIAAAAKNDPTATAHKLKFIAYK